MANPQQNPTRDYRKYPKGPNFLGIVIASGIVLVLLMIGAWLLVKTKGKKMDPHSPNATPNAMVRPPAAVRLSPGLGQAANV